MIRTERIRNFGIIAHIDSGKTTVSERILYLAGRIHQMGEVHDGTTALDSHPLSREKGITIEAAVSSVVWRDHHLNLIDTPGHVDFTAEVERSCRVLDGAVAVFCAVAGVQAQSETVWRQAERHGVPRLIFINKVDRAGANVDRVVSQLRDRLGANPVILTYPWMVDDRLCGVIDVIDRSLHRFGDEDKKSWQRETLPESERERCDAYRRQLSELVAADSEELLERYCSSGILNRSDVIAGLRVAVRSGMIHPVLCGSALATVGIQPLLDAIVDLLPDPTQARPALMRSIDGVITASPSSADSHLPVRALVFKVVSTDHGELGFCRVYQGTLRAGEQVLCPNRRVNERIARLVKLHGPQQTSVAAVGPGDLCAIVGNRQASTGDTLCSVDQPAVLEGIAFAEPVVSMAIEPDAGVDHEALAKALARLAREDPTFRRNVDSETGQLMISGMGELHLEVLIHRLEHQYRLHVQLGRPRVALRQRITRTVDVRGRYVHQSGGPGAYGDVKLRLRPMTVDESADGTEFIFVSAIRGGAVDRCYWAAVEDGVRIELERGGKEGVRIVNVHATLVDGSMHTQDSNERAFQAAGALAVREALSSLGLELLEPWMGVTVECPADFVGGVIGSLNARRGRIDETAPLGGGFVAVTAEAPMAELFGYAVTLRSLTQGRGSCALLPVGFRPVRMREQRA
jgi:elongation factor G